ncbi:MAG: hypothetical protein JO154_26300 [Chitinophaga sp.]|uniref:hypothetical protein n=1 Tax=Chitinophaga sp. TaxID=1869181 RepID=UPI0025C682D6|nr:hypothetical protein [Chitinophaga sp.]MBV8256134.1 hypothetical protein [Chitinophaga sp.]
MSALLRSIALALLCLPAVDLFAQNCTINAGVTTSICPNNKFILSGSSSGLVAVNPVWTQVAGPAVTIKDPQNLTTEVTGYVPGNTYKFRLSSKCTDGSLIFDEVVYNTYPATLANVGPDISVCAPGTILHANTPGSGETGTWSIDGNGQGISFNMADQNNPNLAITVDPQKSGSTTLHWMISSNNSCRSTDDIVITNPGGVMPVSAGADQVLNNCYTVTQTAAMQASFGGTNINGQQGTWSVLSGPTVPSFSNIHDNKAIVGNLAAGTYKLRWTVQGPCANGTADVMLTVPVGTQSVTVAKDASATYCDGRTSTIITGLAPAYAGESIAWTRVSGTGDIQSPNSVSTGITNLTGVKSVFNYTISNPTTGCNTTGSYTINFTTPPTITAPSPVIPPCGSTLVTINYSYTGGDKTQWALISAPSGVPVSDFQDAGQPLILPEYTIPGAYLVRLRRTTNNGLGGCQDAYTDVYVQLSQAPTAANAGTRQVLACNITETHLAGNMPAVGIGRWSQVSGPSVANIQDKSDPTTLINQLANGTYTFRWIITGNVGCPNQQADVQVVVSDRNPTAAAAGQNETICNSTPYKLQGNKPNPNESGRWTFTPTTGVSLSDPTDPNAIANGLQPNTVYTFTWTISNSCGQAAANVTITTSAQAGPQQAHAGPDQCLPPGTTSFTLAGNTPANNETGKWTLVSGNTLNIADNTKNNSNVTGATNGSYSLEWSLASNGCPPTRDTVIYTISAPATPANAGTGGNLCGATSIQLAANAPQIGIGTWSQQQGPGGIAFDNIALNNAKVSNLSDGRYIFRWTISNGACASNYSEVTYNITAPPGIANAGPDQNVCGTNTATLAANAITNGIGTWSIISGPSNPKFTNPTDPNTTVSNLKTGSYTLLWTAVSGPDCPVSKAQMILTVRESAKVQQAMQQLCNATTAVVSGNEGSKGTWTQTGGPAGAVITPNADNSAVVTNLIPGNTYKFTYTIAAIPGCNSSSDDATVITSALPSTANAGPDQQFCLPTGTPSVNTTMQATPATAGTGTWTVETKPAGAADPVIVTPSAFNTAIQNLVPGIYVFSWTVSNGYCTSNSDIMRIVVSATPSDPQPGPDQVNACTDKILLNAQAPLTGIGTWSFESVPTGSTAVIEGINAPSTRVLNTIVGAYIFRWTVSNGICPSKSALVHVNVSSTPPNPAVANVGNIVPGELCDLTGTGSNITLHGNAPQNIETGNWTITDAGGTPVALTFTPTDPNTTVSNVPAGSYIFRWTINSGSCSSFSDLPVTVYAKPTPANAGTTQGICLYTPLQLNATNPTIGKGAWSVVTNAGGTPVFSDINNSAATVNGLAPGAYTFRWTTSNGVCPVSTADVQANVDDCRIKVTKAATTPTQQPDGSYTMNFTFTVANPATAVTIDNVQLTDYIPASLPNGVTYTISGHSLTGITGYNPAFDGKTDTNLLLPNTASLAPGATATITLTINVKFF